MNTAHENLTDTRPTAGEIARNVLKEEAEAITSYLECADPHLERAISAIYESRGPLIVSGIGKSGHIAHKIASTFRSLGKPAAFLHAAEASHGDLGIIQHDSVVLVLSNSGETSELSDLLHYCREHSIFLIGLTGPADSTLARVADIAICYGKVREACVNGLAPTTSTTISLAIGDALAVGTSALMDVAPEDFRRYHPGGKLGSRLLTAESVMKTGTSMPLVEADSPMSDVVVVMSEKSLGTAVIMDGTRASGVITDGDMRRNVTTLWSSLASDVATHEPVRIAPDCLVVEALNLMNEHEITSCLVEDVRGDLIGILHIHDCLAGRSS